MKGTFILIVGPSAVGKTELVRALVEKIPESARLVTTTTRLQRENERNGVDYFFTDRPTFEKGIAEGDFFEYADVYGNYYGSSKKVLADFRERYRYVFAIVDVRGAATLKAQIPDLFSIFIRPDSLESLGDRLARRKAKLTPGELEKRLETIAHEISLSPTFDAVIDNREGHFAETVGKAIKIINVV